MERPWILLVLLALELDGYRELPAHEPGWLGARVGVSAAEEATCIALLVEGGVAAWEGDKLVSRRPRSLSFADAGLRAALLTWQATRPDPEGLHELSVVAVSSEVRAALEALHRQTAEQVRLLTVRSTSAEHLMWVHTALVAL